MAAFVIFLSEFHEVPSTKFRNLQLWESRIFFTKFGMRLNGDKDHVVDKSTPSVGFSLYDIVLRQLLQVCHKECDYRARSLACANGTCYFLFITMHTCRSSRSCCNLREHTTIVWFITFTGSTTICRVRTHLYSTQKRR